MVEVKNSLSPSLSQKSQIYGSTFTNQTQYFQTQNPITRNKMVNLLKIFNFSLFDQFDAFLIWISDNSHIKAMEYYE